MPRLADNQLLAAAGRCFRTQGYFRTRMERVAQEVPCSKVTLYRHFADKTALAEAWLGRCMVDTRETVNAIIESDASFETRFAAIVRHKTRLLELLGDRFTRDLFSPHCPDALQGFLSEQKHLNKVQLEWLIRTGRASGAIHPDLGDDLVRLLLDHFERLFTDPTFLDLVPADKRIETLVGLFLHGLALTNDSNGDLAHD